MSRTRLIPTLLTMVLIAGACGSTSSTTDSADQADDGPAIAAICEEGVVDCDDTVDPNDFEPVGGDDEPVVNSGVLVNGGLSVEDALTADAGGVLAVSGFLVADQRTIRLCDLLAESFPPQCGGASVEIDVDDLDDVVFDDEVPVESSQGVAWTDSIITLLGELVDDKLVPATAT